MSQAVTNEHLKAQISSVNQRLDLEVVRPLQDIRAEAIKHNNRLTKLERWVWALGGGLTLLTFLLANQLVDFRSLLSPDARAEKAAEELLRLQLEIENIQEIQQ